MGPIFQREMKSSLGLDLERTVLEKAPLGLSNVPDELLEILFSSDSQQQSRSVSKSIIFENPN